MLKFYTNRELAGRLGINLAKWKRWSRAFLPPDPLGGLQSGFARQYHPDQAFTVCLGGLLVADLKFSMPDAQKILDDLGGWFRENGYCFHARANAAHPYPAQMPAKRHVLVMAPDRDGGYDYVIREMISRTAVRHEDAAAVEERFKETVIRSSVTVFQTVPATGARLIHISTFLENFVRILDIDPSHYRALCGLNI